MNWLIRFSGAALVASGFACADEQAPRRVNFAAEVRPILAKTCYACHGPDQAQRKAKLRLDNRADTLGDRDGHRLIVPGNVEESELFQRLVSEEPAERMPPAEGKRLDPDQIETLRRWIAEGASWEDHWAYSVPVRPTVPAVSDPAWPRSPLDTFVLARLDLEKLQPSPQAERATLLRRVCVDLTGLPPTPEQSQEFLEDSSPDAYERLVDRLLANPALGERWGAVWLDLARYADTKGYEKDLKRNIYRYRDWVINAYNADLPYSDFTTEQLAGDLIPAATPEQRLATAFHRNTLTNDEGGTDDEEFRMAAVKDRVDTTVQVFMGLTMGCAKCHRHKYDPISLRDYYQFLAFFNQTADSDRFDDGPLEPFPSSSDQAQIESLNTKAKQTRQAIHEKLTEGTPSRLASWETDWNTSQNAWQPQRPAKMESRSGSEGKLLEDSSILFAAQSPATEQYRLEIPGLVGPLAAVRLEALPDPVLPRKGVGRSQDDGNFVLSGINAWIRSADGTETRLEFSEAQADFAQDQYPVEHALKNPDPKKHGWAVSPRQAEQHQAVFKLAAPAQVPAGATVVIQLSHEFELGSKCYALGRFRLATTGQTGPGLTPTLPADIAKILQISQEQREPNQLAALEMYVAGTIPELKDLRESLKSLDIEIAALKNRSQTPVLQELPQNQRRVSRVHNRGNFLDPGDPVEAAVPESFPPLPSGAPENRLGVAHWLVHESNPLTTRVAVNRVWAQFFGLGLVETQEDFGLQGQAPSHPELLDWLATDLRDHGWSLKHLCRTIVTSATYRQSSRTTPELLSKDRTNRLLARGPRFRLDGETIRDSALAVSGLLSRKMLGPSVMPLQPDGIWQSTYNSDRWVLSPGSDRHRRGIYTFWKRTSPYPAMMVFDAPSREYCTIRRISTNTPLQALVTLNDPVFVEAAQALARRMVREAGPTPASRIELGLKLALAREPAPREVQALVELYEDRLADGHSHPEQAVKLATEPIGPLREGADPAEYAALTAVANVILNLDEFLARH